MEKKQKNNVVLLVSRAEPMKFQDSPDITTTNEAARITDNQAKIRFDNY